VDGNIIAYNGGPGIRVRDPSAVSNTITCNSIHSNTGLGIDNANGGNLELSAPTIALVIGKTITGMACPNCIIEIFSDDEDEGRVYEGSTTANASGNWTFTSTSPLTGPNLTATATDAGGNTSEFSRPVALATRRIYLPLILKNH
jgi:hypothetical protein